MSAALQLVEPDTTELAAESGALVIQAQTMVIVDADGYRAAANFLLGVKALQKKIRDAFLNAKKKADEAHRAICALETEQLQPTLLAEQEAKRRMIAYDAEQDRLRREEEARLREEARKREESRILAEALEAEQDGDDAAAEEIISQPIVPAPVHVAPAAPKVSGITYREDWRAELVSIVDLAKHVAAHPEDSNLLMLNTTAATQMVRARKTAFSIPGLRAVCTKNVAAGGRK